MKASIFSAFAALTLFASSSAFAAPAAASFGHDRYEHGRRDHRRDFRHDRNHRGHDRRRYDHPMGNVMVVDPSEIE